MTTQNSGPDLGNNRRQRLGRVGQSFSGRVLLTMGTNLAVAIMALVTGSLMARLLGPQGRGELAAIQTWPAYIALFAALGLPDAVVYFSSQTRLKSGEYLISAIVALLLSAIPAVAIGCLLMPALLAAQSTTTIVTARWYLGVFVVLQATHGMLLHPLRGQNDFVLWNALRLLNSFGWLVVVVLIGLSQTAAPDTLAFGYLAMSAAVGVPTWLIVRRRVRGPYVVNRRLWRPMLRFGLPSAASAVPQMINLRLDQLVMAAVLAPDRLGYYAVAVAWSGALLPILNSVGAALFPRIAMEPVSNNRIETLGQGTRLGTGLAIVLSSLLLIVTPTVIILLFGRDFGPAIPAALILVAASAILSINGSLEEGLRGLGITKSILWGESVGLLATLAGLIVLLPVLEIVGAAIASLVAYSATSLVLLWQLHRLSGNSMAFFILPRRADWRLARLQLIRVFGILGNHN